MRALVRISASVWKLRIIGASFAQRPGTRKRGRRRARASRRSTLAVARISTDADNDEGVMSKGMNQKKNEKKPPSKTLKEKREAKAEKKKK